MPYASLEKRKEHRKKYYEEHKEKLKEKRREKYQLEKNNWLVMIKEVPIGLIV
jgi:hypothetical protein